MVSINLYIPLLMLMCIDSNTERKHDHRTTPPYTQLDSILIDPIDQRRKHHVERYERHAPGGANAG